MPNKKVFKAELNFHKLAEDVALSIHIPFGKGKWDRLVDNKKFRTCNHCIRTLPMSNFVNDKGYGCYCWGCEDALNNLKARQDRASKLKPGDVTVSNFTGIIPKFDLVKVSKPGDALRAILLRKQAEAAAKKVTVPSTTVDPISPQGGSLSSNDDDLTVLKKCGKCKKNKMLQFFGLFKGRRRGECDTCLLRTQFLRKFGEAPKVVVENEVAEFDPFAFCSDDPALIESVRQQIESSLM